MDQISKDAGSRGADGVGALPAQVEDLDAVADFEGLSAGGSSGKRADGQGKKRNVSIKDKIVRYARIGSTVEAEKVRPPSATAKQPEKNEPEEKKPKAESAGTQPQPRGVPVLNLSTLKHVREYTH